MPGPHTDKTSYFKSACIFGDAICIRAPPDKPARIYPSSPVYNGRRENTNGAVAAQKAHLWSMSSLAVDDVHAMMDAAHPI